MNKKGLASGIIAIALLMFIFAFSSIISITMWIEVNDNIQNLDNTTVPQDVKDKIDDLTSKILWADKLFVLFFVLLLIAYLISASTIPVDKPIFLIVFMFLLIFTTIISMVLSNSWKYLIEHPNFIASAQELPFTTWFMQYLPIIVFFIGLLGALIFYNRQITNPIGAGDQFE